MKTYFVLGGYGEMGRIASRDLAETAKGAKIIVAGRDGKKAKSYAKKLDKKCSGMVADASKWKELADILKKNKVDIVVNCSLYYHNLDVMQACLDAGCHYLDLGGLFHMTRKQLKLHKQFVRRNLIAVLGCGATPGITNVLAAYGARLMDRVESIYVRFADYSWIAPKQHFVVPYTMYTLFDEFTTKPAVFENGKLKFVKPMSGRAEEYFPSPIGKVTAFYTLHSEIATFPSSFRHKGLKNCDFKVSFDEDFVHDVNVLIEAGMASKKYVEVNGMRIRPIDVAVKELNRLIPDNAKVKDIEYVRVTLIGEQGGKKAEMILDCLAHSNQKWHASSWDINTGVAPSIIAQFILDGKIRQRGVLPPEMCVPAEGFFRELEKRGMKIFVNSKRKEF